MDISQHQEEFDKSIEFLRNDISALRTGRASTSLVEAIPAIPHTMKNQFYYYLLAIQLRSWQHA